MLHFPNIDPVILKLGFLEIRWYAVFYIISFAVGYIFLKKNLEQKGISLDKIAYESLISNILLGVILGGRFGYVLFYNAAYYFAHPLEIILPFDMSNGWAFIGIQGMSFHGGAIGVVIASYLFCRKYKINFLKLADPSMSLVCVGLGLGRVGNFINAELYGRVTSMPWGMVFPYTDGRPRHPSQLYEAFLEGLVLFFILHGLNKKNLPTGVVFWAFFLFYGIFRFIVEFFRQPDDHLGLVLFSFSMGQVLCALMIIAGATGIIHAVKKSRQSLEVKNVE